MATCKECGREKEVDWIGWCNDCNDDAKKWVEEKEEEGKSGYGLFGWD